MVRAMPSDQTIDTQANVELDVDTVLEKTQGWLEKVVIGLQLCPFAKAVHVKRQIRYVVSAAQTRESLMEDFVRELHTLTASSPEEIDTTLIIHPKVLQDFFDFNDFLEIVEETIVELGLEGEIQVASFHPDYQFADSRSDDIENYTNRSPYPTLHLLREASVDRAVASFPNASEIYETNMETMRRLGHEGWRSLLEMAPTSESLPPTMTEKK